MTTLLILLACLTGVIIREAMSVASRRNDIPPSFAYYWSQPKNRLMLLINVLCAGGVLLGRGELIAIASSEAFAHEWPRLTGVAYFLHVAPIISGLGIGLFSAFVIRWVVSTVNNRFGAAKRSRSHSE